MLLRAFGETAGAAAFARRELDFGETVNWILARRSIGTSSDTPTSLRAKAADFKKMAMTARDAEIIEELELLAWRYLERAKEMEGATSGSAEVAGSAAEVKPAS